MYSYTSAKYWKTCEKNRRVLRRRNEGIPVVVAVVVAGPVAGEGIAGEEDIVLSDYVCQMVLRRLSKGGTKGKRVKIGSQESTLKKLNIQSELGSPKKAALDGRGLRYGLLGGRGTTTILLTGWSATQQFSLLIQPLPTENDVN